MKKLNKMIALALAVAMMGSATGHAQQYSQEPYAESMGGNGYMESRRSPYLAPAVALGTIALVAIIAVAVNNSSHSSHSHGHSE